MDELVVAIPTQIVITELGWSSPELYLVTWCRVSSKKTLYLQKVLFLVSDNFSATVKIITRIEPSSICSVQAEFLRYKLLRCLAVRRPCNGVLRFVMGNGAKGCEAGMVEFVGFIKVNLVKGSDLAIRDVWKEQIGRVHAARRLSEYRSKNSLIFLFQNRVPRDDLIIDAGADDGARLVDGLEDEEQIGRVHAARRLSEYRSKNSLIFLFQNRVPRDDLIIDAGADDGARLVDGLEDGIH
ncbi:(E)-4-hydroxy-3-methylbut-2-enyl diphosphate synthase [Artemisia annua]|uniref:(E)-4-hydroxy-3-methylbut-2-enyl diphosphate synthase n=1 Tax=Artemisia annua TaxID=35608 RepID=A0A2U1PGX3_ARTAN|nr:(E)-4-hydroxy-3-methylbut-2-enyl diphosphate synthase [Artemisia annua]